MTLSEAFDQYHEKQLKALMQEMWNNNKPSTVEYSQILLKWKERENGI